MQKAVRLSSEHPDADHVASELIFYSYFSLITKPEWFKNMEMAISIDKDFGALFLGKVERVRTEIWNVDLKYIPICIYFVHFCANSFFLVFLQKSQRKTN